MDDNVLTRNAPIHGVWRQTPYKTMRPKDNLMAGSYGICWSKKLKILKCEKHKRRHDLG